MANVAVPNIHSFISTRHSMFILMHKGGFHKQVKAGANEMVQGAVSPLGKMAKISKVGYHLTWFSHTMEAIRCGHVTHVMSEIHSIRMVKPIFQSQRGNLC